MPVGRRIALPTLFFAILVSLAMAFAASSAHAAVGDIGTKDFVFDTDGTGGTSITGSKPESKLWFNDGTWWADMAASAGPHKIYKLNRTTQVWSPTATGLDSRFKSVSDILWDGAAGKLYVASHTITSTSATTGSGTDGKLFRYSYDTATDTYSIDAGFSAGVNIGSPKTESLVIDKDSTGRLWATWQSGGKIYVNHTSGVDTAWGTPYILPGSVEVNADDLPSLIAFKGRIGVVWSNQTSGTKHSGTEFLRYGQHIDGTGDTAADWAVQNIPTGWSPDDHINLKADSQGNLFVATKTSEDVNTNPLTLLLRRSFATGNWTTAVYGLESASHTRPIVLLDEANNTLRMLATCPQPPGKSGQSGGDICEKTSSMSNPSFSDPASLGTPVIRDTTSANMNDVTSTKQNLTSATGIVVLASDKDTNLYWHSDRSISGGTTPPPGPTAPVADFTANQVSGTGTLNVQFTDTSTNTPTTWAWDFGDGTTSASQNPSHMYLPGTYTVTLTASNAGGTDVEQKVGYITVTSAPDPGTGTTTTFTVNEDAPVKSTSATKNYGTDTQLRLRAGTSASDTTYYSYLKFNVAGLPASVTGAKLRLFVTDGSPDGGRVFKVDNTWSESTITWANKPAIGATAIGTVGATSSGWVDIPLTAASFTGNGTYSFGMTNTSSNSAYYTSREGTNQPQLILTTGSGGTTPPPGPTAVAAEFSGTPTSGTAPLNVQFTDASAGSPTAWSWTFGDGGTSAVKNPAHTYTTPGTYTVTLVATRTSDSSTDTETKTGYITVGTVTPPPTGTTITLNPVADTNAKSSSPTSNYGTASTLQLRQGDASNNVTYWSYLKFDVTGLSGPVSGAKLRLYTTDASPDGGTLYEVADNWTETALTWANKPALPASSIASLGAVTAGTWKEIPLGSTITGDGTYSFALTTASTNSAIYASREAAAAQRPQLVLPQ